MELNLNTNPIRTYSLDEDDSFSNISRISCGLCNSDSECSAPISVRDMIHHYNNQFKKEEANHKIKYKINAAKRPHLQHHSQHLLAATKSSYCGLNSYGSHMNSKQFTDQMPHKSSPTIDEHNHIAITCCKNCSACMCCQNRNHTNSTTTKMLSSTSSSLLLQQNNENIQKPNSNFGIHNNTSGGCIRSSNSSSSSNTNCNKINAKDTRHILVVENCSSHSNKAHKADINDTTTIRPTILNDFNAELNKDLSNGLFNKDNSQIVVEKQTKNRLLSTDSTEEANICQEIPIETSYQSKTTIAKTSSGVRIIIDIFFDQERCANPNDIVGSRVETDIPQSRILTEFQQQTMSTYASNTTSNNNII